MDLYRFTNSPDMALANISDHEFEAIVLKLYLNNQDPFYNNYNNNSSRVLWTCLWTSEPSEKK